jgi:hypothetical protein
MKSMKKLPKSIPILHDFSKRTRTGALLLRISKSDYRRINLEEEN